MLTIGLTGPTGAGKTTVLAALAAMGCVCVDCDALYHQLLASSPALVRELTDRFGRSILNCRGQVDTRALAPIVFSDPQALADLNAIAHRHVKDACAARLREAEEAGARGVALDAIALLESGLGALCDVTVAVVAPAEVRLARIMARDGISQEQAAQRMAAQPDNEYYVNWCDLAVINDGTKTQQALQAELARLFADKLC